jgi:hypothetical protein
MPPSSALVAILNLVSLSLTANLILIAIWAIRICYSGHHVFAGRPSTEFASRRRQQIQGDEQATKRQNPLQRPTATAIHHLEND